MTMKTTTENMTLRLEAVRLTRLHFWPMLAMLAVQILLSCAWCVLGHRAYFRRNKPLETCFCGTFGIDASDPAGDMVCWEDETYIYLTAKTEYFRRSIRELCIVQICI